MQSSRISQDREPRAAAHCERRPNVSAILLLGLGLLWWVEPASAHENIVSYSLTVSIHPAVHPQLTQNEVENILKGASNILQGHTNITSHNSCQVEFKFNGFIPFPASAPADIKNADDLEAVHSAFADAKVVKVVQSISFCAQGTGLYLGCAWRPGGRQRTVIVAREAISDGVGAVVLAHEFGHTTGLLHRNQNDNLNLMTPCVLEPFNQQVNQDECAHFRAGPVSHYPPGSGPNCPNDSSARSRTK